MYKNYPVRQGIEVNLVKKADAPVPELAPLPADILFLRLRLLGDIVFTIPAVAAFKRLHPRTRIHYGVEERFREIASLIPGVDRVWTLAQKRGWRDILAFGRQARERGIGAVVDFHSGPASALLTLASRAPLRIGYRSANRNWAYNRLVPRFDQGRPAHSVHNQVRLVEALAGVGIEPPPYPEIDAGRFAPPPRLRPIAPGRPAAVIHLGAGNRFRDWGLDHFQELVARLSRRGISCLLIGSSPQEQERGSRLAAAPHAQDLTGAMTVGELMALVAGAAVYVGADSGPLHVASLTPTPLVALYGPNVTAVSGPWRRRDVTVLELGMDCRPCSQRSCRYGTMPCMRNISVEAVDEAVSQYLR